MAHQSYSNDPQVYQGLVQQNPSYASNATHEDSSRWFTQENPEADPYTRVVGQISENVILPANGNIEVDFRDWDRWKKFLTEGTKMIVRENVSWVSSSVFWNGSKRTILCFNGNVQT
ncbi:unnamed protein product [Clavelina lepadiformis]|uniref:Uncharacterized protein n=1 Tax=Clavelina lepadiformis TaxID=159417 RepID=A0ABP0FKR5_CLALP